MARMSFEDYSSSINTSKGSSNGPRVSYFGLKDDGDSAIVRFNIHGLEDIAVDSVHRVKTGDGKTRTVSCLRSTPKDPIDDCPFCKNGEQPMYRIFIPLVEYRQGQNGTVEIVPAVWEQGVKTRNVLKGRIEEYGDLTNSLFKITRRGRTGSKDTTYDILPANPNVYKDEVFVKDMSAFDDPSYMNHFVMVKTADEIAEFYRTGDFPHGVIKPESAPAPKSTYNAPAYSAPTSPVSSNEPIRGTYEAPATGNGNGPRRYTY